jgi:hypothetical protein
MERPRQPQRWPITDKDREMLQIAAIVLAWNWDAHNKKKSVDEEAENLRRDMNAARDASIPCSVFGARHNRNAYWWTLEIAELRASKIQACRRLQRARRRRHHDEEEIYLCHEAYRKARHILQQTINKAKTQFRIDLVQSTDSDP